MCEEISPHVSTICSRQLVCTAFLLSPESQQALTRDFDSWQGCSGGRTENDKFFFQRLSLICSKHFLLGYPSKKSHQTDNLSFNCHNPVGAFVDKIFTLYSTEETTTISQKEDTSGIDVKGPSAAGHTFFIILAPVCAKKGGQKLRNYYPALEVRKSWPGNARKRETIITT